MLNAYPSGGINKYTNLASQLLPMVKECKAIIYVDFIRDVAPLAINLRQSGLESCGYHGEKMTSNDKHKTLENWRSGHVMQTFSSARESLGILARLPCKWMGKMRHCGTALYHVEG